ncbi:hypothetical protein Purlil1_13047 [Purpureocillium lilacinum]|uniref:Uncharacterized protein n=1 Tax=Purpureocillium lilacinum TaxID=33203 RepID=A0ABR0BFC4_PURLI|nr:hypothetical protein Purlil1_13047 [Purpureocillium lilacinum]
MRLQVRAAAASCSPEREIFLTAARCNARGPEQPRTEVRGPLLALGVNGITVSIAIRPSASRLPGLEGVPWVHVTRSPDELAVGHGCGNGSTTSETKTAADGEGRFEQGGWSRSGDAWLMDSQKVVVVVYFPSSGQKRRQKPNPVLLARPRKAELSRSNREAAFLPPAW